MGDGVGGALRTKFNGFTDGFASPEVVAGIPPAAMLPSSGGELTSEREWAKGLLVAAGLPSDDAAVSVAVRGARERDARALT